MDVGITVEERDWPAVLKHGAVAGLLAGIALGLAQFIISLAFRESALTPFRLVCALVFGSPTRVKSMPGVLVVLMGGSIHLLISILMGIIFAAVLSLGWQLSARRRVLIMYGALFGFLLYEVSFLAVLPVFYPGLESWFDLENQLTKGIAAYALVYGPVLAIYLSVARPGVRAPWADLQTSTKRVQSHA